MHRSILILPAVVLLLWTGCTEHEPNASVLDLPVVSVRTASVSAANEPRFQALTGTVRPARQAIVAARIMGTVDALHVRLGQEVRAGDVLVELSAPEVNARVAQAEAALAQATRDHQRETNLLARGASTEDTVRTMLDRRNLAEANLAEVKAMQAYTKVVAPFDAIVTRRPIDIGDLAMPGDALLYLDSNDSLQVEFGLPQSLANLEIGDELEVTNDLDTARGRLVELSSAAEARSRTIQARLDLPQGTKFRSGQFVRVLAPAGQGTELRIPASAVTAAGQIERVFVVENGRAVLRIVRTARSGKVEDVRILAGLAEGEAVVTPVPAGLIDGQPVELAR